jgi:hypothetical protein
MAIVLPVDLNDVAATQVFKVADPDTYELEIKSVKAGTSKAGNPKLDLRLVIINNDEFDGIGIFDTITLTKEAMFRLKQYSLATGLEIAGEFDEQDLVGLQLSAVVDVEPVKDASGQIQFQEDGQPKLRNVIKRILFKE